MSEDPPEVVMEDAPPSDRDETSEAEASHDESDDEAPVDLMVKTRERRANAGNRMATLLAKSAEEEEWGEEWEEAPNEEEFRGDDVNEQEDYNMDSSSSEEDDDGADEDDAGEKELRKAERHERNKKRKAATNPFTARAAVAARKKVKLNVPRTQSPTHAPPRPKKKSERASWLPTEEDGPVRMSKRKQTVANKDATLAKLKEKDRRRDDTLAMMKAAEARKMKAKEKPLTQAERLAEAARNERINKKTLHRWEEAEEARAAERQAKIDALKNRQIGGPFYRYYSGPGIWVDDKLKYTGKDAPSLEHLDEKLNKEVDNPSTQLESTTEQPDVSTAQPEQPSEHHTDDSQPAFASLAPFHPPMSSTLMPAIPATLPQQETSHIPWTTAASQGGDVFMGSHGMTQSSNVMFAPPNQDSFLYGIDQYAPTPAELPPNPFTQASPFQQQYPTCHPPFSPHPQPYPPHTDQPIPPNTSSSAIGPQDLLAQFQLPAVPPPPPRRKTIRRALRNLLILSNFPNLEAPPPTLSRSRMSASLLRDKDKSALVQLYVALFHWTPAEATSHIHQTIIAPPKPPRKNAAHKPDAEIGLKPGQKLCPITNSIARYRDPETGIAYRDARAFGVLRGVVGGGFVWSGDLGCYVGGRAKPLESMGGKGFLGMPPAKNVPRRFWEMSTSQAQAPKRVVPPSTPTTPATTVAQTGAGGEAQTQGHGQSQTAGRDHSLVVTTTTAPTTTVPVKTDTSAPS
ncbi:YL1 multi-domain protein [Pyrenophora tritici-repentis]|uniref:YL1 nuclear protein n=1 Tax=Pyrenophora tritici-repentis TaxID=45151 RepID=A0A2W1HVE7_9PLEO|nr:YL1 multi-domain protein [Pyrenophora tritici-repentis]KAG9376594.1 YL1 multi-domain protein [Pyrenophora tritici-repentis]KAI0622403.1 YL1 multi-domain protein [Pyrenophora tritici-repentis]KAI1511558.1 YL1 nuclear protein [Pyrenophora tritici-repentis]KAI1593260.1 signal protein [Pyrenophora tritici-repentis]